MDKLNEWQEPASVNTNTEGNTHLNLSSHRAWFDRVTHLLDSLYPPFLALEHHEKAYYQRHLFLARLPCLHDRHVFDNQEQTQLRALESELKAQQRILVQLKNDLPGLAHTLPEAEWSTILAAVYEARQMLNSQQPTTPVISETHIGRNVSGASSEASPPIIKYLKQTLLPHLTVGDHSVFEMKHIHIINKLIISLPPIPSSPLPTLFHMRAPTQHFVGRKEDLKQLTQDLHQNRHCIITQAITGLGGMGKTQLMRRYAQYHRHLPEMKKITEQGMPSHTTQTVQTEESPNRVRHDKGKGKVTHKNITKKTHDEAQIPVLEVSSLKYRLIWGFDASHSDAIEQGYIQLATKLNDVLALAPPIPTTLHSKQCSIEIIIERVHETLSQFEPWLLCFDDVKDEKSLQLYLPKQLHSNGHCLVTSRYSHWQEAKLYRLRVLTEHDAILLLCGGRCALNELNATELGIVKGLAKDLGYFPLALTQARGYLINHSNIGFDQYRTLFRAEMPSSDLFVDAPLDYKKTVMTTLTISIDAICEEHPEISRYVIALLHYLAYLDGTVSWELLQVLMTKIQSASTFSTFFSTFINMLAQFIGLAKKAFDLDSILGDVITLLDRYSIIDIIKVSRVGQLESITLHSMVQYAQRKGHNESRQVAYLKAISYLLIQQYEKETQVREDESRRTQLISQLITVLARWRNVCNKKSNASTSIESIGLIGELHYWHGYVLHYYQGRYQAADKAYRACRKAWRRANVPKLSAKTARLLHDFANVIGRMGDSQQEKNLLEEALNIKESLYGLDHIETVRTLGSLSNVMGDLGDTERQKQLLEKVLRIHIRHYGRDHVRTAIALENLAITVGDLGDSQQQKKLLEEALRINLREWGESHAKTAYTRHNLALAVGELGDTKQKEALFKKVLEFDKKHYGQDHELTLGALSGIASAQCSLEHWDEFYATIDKIKTSLSHHPIISPYAKGYIYTTISHAYMLKDNYGEARNMLDKAFKEFQLNTLHVQCAYVAIQRAYCASCDSSVTKEERQELIQNVITWVNAHFKDRMAFLQRSLIGQQELLVSFKQGLAILRWFAGVITHYRNDTMREIVEQLVIIVRKAISSFECRYRKHQEYLGGYQENYGGGDEELAFQKLQNQSANDNNIDQVSIALLSARQSQPTQSARVYNQQDLSFAGVNTHLLWEELSTNSHDSNERPDYEQLLWKSL